MPAVPAGLQYSLPSPSVWHPCRRTCTHRPPACLPTHLCSSEPTEPYLSSQNYGELFSNQIIWCAAGLLR